MDDTPGTVSSTPRKRGRGFLWSFFFAVIAFGAGFGWQYYEKTQVQDELAATQQELMVERLRVRLGQAAIAAQAGDYESARQRMSNFFTQLDQVAPTLPEPIAGVGTEFLAMRDDIITGLSRANPQYANILYGMLDRFRSAAGLDEQMAAPPAAAESTPAGQPDSELQLEPVEPDSQMPADTAAETGG